MSSIDSSDAPLFSCDHRQVHRVKSFDGTMIYAEELWNGPRRPEGNPLIFLYGLGCSIEHWKYQIEFFLKKRRRILWLDYRAHGRSETPEDWQSISIKGCAGDAISLLRQLKIRSGFFLGQSMGGTVALKIAMENPDLCQGIVLLGTPAKPPRQIMQLNKLMLAGWKGAVVLSEFLQPAVMKKVLKIPRPLKPLLIPIIRFGGFNGDLSRSEDIEAYVEKLLSFDPAVFWQMARSCDEFDFGACQESVQVPALIIAGGQDLIVPLDESRWLAKRLPGAELFVVPHGSHCPHLDDPPLICRQIAKFIDVYDGVGAF